MCWTNWKCKLACWIRISRCCATWPPHRTHHSACRQVMMRPPALRLFSPTIYPHCNHPKRVSHSLHLMHQILKMVITKSPLYLIQSAFCYELSIDTFEDLKLFRRSRWWKQLSYVNHMPFSRLASIKQPNKHAELALWVIIESMVIAMAQPIRHIQERNYIFEKKKPVKIHTIQFRVHLNLIQLRFNLNLWL